MKKKEAPEVDINSILPNLKTNPVKIPVAVTLTDVSAAGKLIYGALLNEVDELGGTLLQAEKLALIAGITRQAVYLSVYQLEMAGLLRIEKQSVPGLRRTDTKIHLRFKFDSTEYPDQPHYRWKAKLKVVSVLSFLAD